MSVIIVLKRNHQKKNPHFFITVRDSSFLKKTIDNLGYVNLISNPKKVCVNVTKLLFWLKHGATIKNKKLLIFVASLLKPIQ
jgi:ribosomal protein S16